MKRYWLMTACVLIAFPAFAVDDAQHPEPATPTIQNETRGLVTAPKAMVAAAHPLAVEAGYKVLESGGNAVDAAIATQLVLNVVEPQSSGIGGGGFMLVWDAKAKKLSAYDGRETAPMAVDENLFANEFGEVFAFNDAVESGISVGVPGMMRLLGTVYARHGKTKWSTLFDDATHIATEGFPMSPRLYSLLNGNPRIEHFAHSFRPFLDSNNAVKAEGELIKNPELAKTFATLAQKGPEAFYEGDIAKAIVEAVSFSPRMPGKMTLSDLRDYRAVERSPLCGTYREYKICSMPLPSSGGIAILQAMRIIELLPEPLDKHEPGSVKAAHYFAEASKLAYADRNRYAGDPDFYEAPVNALLSEHYLKSRVALISANKAMAGKIEAGDPALVPPEQPKEDGVATQPEAPSTTHISVVDAEGNAVALTSSIEQGFGSGLSAGGFLLNNQLTDFSFQSVLDDEFMTPHPNRVQAGKRPRSSMSPTMVFDKDGALLLVVGSPGGGRIIDYVLQTLLGVLDWKLNIQDAINLPHIISMNAGVVELEKGTKAAELEAGLKALGHAVAIEEENSGLHGIAITPDGLQGGADLRREGIAKGF